MFVWLRDMRWFTLPLLAAVMLLAAGCEDIFGPAPEMPSTGGNPTPVPTATPIIAATTSVTLDPPNAECGTSFVISGEGFDPHQALAIIADPENAAIEMARVTTSRWGSFSARLLGFNGTSCVAGSQIRIIAADVNGTGPSAETVFAIGSVAPAGSDPQGDGDGSNQGGNDTPAIPADAPTYTVRSGDTLWGIATNYGITVEALRSANQMTEATPLRPGATLVIPVSPRS